MSRERRPANSDDNNKTLYLRACVYHESFELEMAYVPVIIVVS